jgi:hypothetical protein
MSRVVMAAASGAPGGEPEAIADVRAVGLEPLEPYVNVMTL